MEKSIKQLAIRINLERGKDTQYNMPISHIDGLPVSVKLIYWLQSKGMSLKIFTDEDECAWEIDEINGEMVGYHLWEQQFDKLEGESPVDLTARVLTYAKDNIPKMKFDKYTGTLKMNEGQVKTAELFQELFTCETVKLSFEKCSVCFDLTKCTTKCGHHLCHMCFSGIKRTMEEEYDSKVKKCPVCRELILL